SESEECLPGIDLSVVLAFPNASAGRLGVHMLLNEHSMQDVEGFLSARETTDFKTLEAEKLALAQQDLGIHFDTVEGVPIDRLIIMEDRDRGELAKWQESNGPQ
ncbi:hypothetical protein A2U01_0033429, partial [Trifolium medium]|nr:hypothetical protein [Trifolium medium]